MIKFYLTFFDIYEFNKYFMTKNANFLQKYLHWILFAFFSVLLFFLLHNNQAPIRSYVVAVILLVAMVFIQKAFTQFLRRKNITKYVQQNPKVLAERELIIEKDKFVVVIDGKNMDYPLKAITKLDESKFHYFAYVSKQSAVIIPKRILAQFPEVNKLVERMKNIIAN